MAGQRALDEHYVRSGIKAKAVVTKYGYRIKFDLPDALPLVSIIIPTRNGKKILQNCIESILEKSSYKKYEILVVDNDSDEPETLEYFSLIQKNKKIKVIKFNGKFNYSAINNYAVKNANGEVIALVNNDIEVISEDWLSEMVSIAIQPRVGAVGAKLLYEDGRLQHGGVLIGLGGVAGHANKYAPKNDPGYCCRSVLIQSMSAVTAACMVIRKDVYLEVGGLDELNLKVAFNDVDFCLRVKEAGYKNIWTPHAQLYHHESATRGAEDSAEKKLRFQAEVEYMKERWSVFLRDGDPAYSPNLTLDYEDFSLAWPPRTNWF
jgi:GT2 family glycosyltransferase